MLKLEFVIIFVATFSFTISDSSYFRYLSICNGKQSELFILKICILKELKSVVSLG